MGRWGPGPAVPPGARAEAAGPASHVATGASRPERAPRARGGWVLSPGARAGSRPVRGAERLEPAGPASGGSASRVVRVSWGGGGRSPLGGRPAFVSCSEAQAGAARRERRAGEGAQAAALAYLQVSPTPRPGSTPGGPGGGAEAGGASDSGFPPGSCSGGRRAAGGRGGGRAPRCPGARPALSARGPRGWAWRASAGAPGAPGLGVWAAQRGVCSAALRVSSELVPMRGGAEGIWAGRWGASWDLGCRSWGRAAEAADGWSHVGAARHRGRDGCGSPSCHLESDRRSSQGSQFRRLTGPPPEAAHRTLDPTGPPVSAVPLGGSLGPILSLVDPGWK